MSTQTKPRPTGTTGEARGPRDLLPRAGSRDTSVPLDAWLLATAALGRTAPAGQAYPHICGRIVYPRPGGPEIRLRARDCAACGERREGQDGGI